jgi:putative transcriptional regulator
LTGVDSEIRRMREEAGLSQGSLAVELGVSRQTINAIETGKYDPSLTLAVRLARHFGSTVEEVFHVDHE